MTSMQSNLDARDQSQVQNEDADDSKVFERCRPHLEGLIYRILGSHVEAEDVLQDTFIKWWQTPKSKIRKPEHWLTAVATRKAIDALRSARIKRTAYFGEWLPEPIPTQLQSEQAYQHERASSLSTAFLLVLERLSATERAAYLLKDVFAYSHAMVAETLQVTEANSRKLVSRAKAKLAEGDLPTIPRLNQQKMLIGAFEHAIKTGETEPLKALLADDVKLIADGGGKVTAIAQPIIGNKTIVFITQNLRAWWAEYSLAAMETNGTLGLVVYRNDDLVGIVSFGYTKNARIKSIQIMRNPDKLRAFQG